LTLRSFVSQRRQGSSGDLRHFSLCQIFHLRVYGSGPPFLDLPLLSATAVPNKKGTLTMRLSAFINYTIS
jgi:hypothetical protein